MALRYVELNEAASMLGLTPDQLIEKRSRGEIHGYRDGASWKFKIDEIERLKGEMAGGPADEGPIPFDDDADAPVKSPGTDEEQSSVLVSDATVGPQAEGTPSKVIGKSGDVSDADSDLSLAGSDLKLAADSSVTLSEGKAGASVDSDVALVPGMGTGSDVRLVPDPGSDKSLKAPSGGGADVLGDSELKLKSGSSGGTGSGGTNKGLGSGLSSGDLDIALDSELALSEDDEMVLGGSGVDSDLTLNPAADSGINLASPSDSGLSLEADSGISLQTPTDSGLSLEEEGVDMGGSSISALELPEDESVELEAEPEQNLKKDEEFLLSPSDEMFTDESDSGSQVIALEDSAAFDQDAAMLGGPGALLAETAIDKQLGALGGGAAVAAPAFGVPRTMPEADYSFWNIAGLAAILFFFALSGIFIGDIINNMWAWEDDLDVSSSMATGITGALFGK